MSFIFTFIGTVVILWRVALVELVLSEALVFVGVLEVNGAVVYTTEV